MRNKSNVMRPLPISFIQVNDLDEIIFARRNKAYGAYDLRKHYNERLLKAFMITASTTLVFLSLLMYSNSHQEQQPKTPWPIIPDTLSTVVLPIVEIHKIEPPAAEVQSDVIPTTVVKDSTLPEIKPDTTTVPLIADAGPSHEGDTTSQGAVVSSSTIGSESGAGKGSGTASDFTYAPEVFPSFPGGYQAFSRYVQRHFTCSSENISRGAPEGKIVLRFFVLKDGSITNVEVLKDNVGIDCADEAKNMLRNSPKWNPGLQNNQPINVIMVLPISILRE